MLPRRPQMVQYGGCHPAVTPLQHGGRTMKTGKTRPGGSSSRALCRRQGSAATLPILAAEPVRRMVNVLRTVHGPSRRRRYSRPTFTSGWRGRCAPRVPLPRPPPLAAGGRGTRAMTEAALWTRAGATGLIPPAAENGRERPCPGVPNAMPPMAIWENASTIPA